MAVIILWKEEGSLNYTVANIIMSASHTLLNVFVV